MSRRVVHVITGLSMGGAEMMLYRLLEAHQKQGEIASEVISLSSIGAVGERIQALGVPVRALGMRPALPNPLLLLRLARMLRQAGPDLVQTWMYHADLLGGLAARLAGIRAVAWGLHNTNLSPGGNKGTTIWTAWACARMSYVLPRGIVCCSEASRVVHAGLGYAAGKMIMIPNGFDTTMFNPDPEAAARIRAELGVVPDVPLVGIVARYHPLKDHANFIGAAAHVARQDDRARFLMVGPDIDADNIELTGLLERHGLRERALLLGRRDDTPAVMSALDVLVSSSVGEAFPLVLGEAMACGTICVATDVGDSRLIVGDTGAVAPPSDPEALGAGILAMLRLSPDERATRSEAGRRRIEVNFKIESVAGRYADYYDDLITRRSRQ